MKHVHKFLLLILLMVATSLVAACQAQVESREKSSIERAGVSLLANAPAVVSFDVAKIALARTIPNSKQAEITICNIKTGIKTRVFPAGQFVKQLQFSNGGTELLVLVGEHSSNSDSQREVTSAISAGVAAKFTLRKYYIWKKFWDPNLVIEVPVAPLFFSRDGKLMACPVHGGIGVWDLVTGEQWTLKLAPISVLAISADKKVIAAASEGGRVDFLDSASGALLRSFGVSKPGTTCDNLQFSPDGKYLAASKSGIFSVWDINSGAELWSEKSQKAALYTPALFSASSKLLAFACLQNGKKAIEIRETGSGKSLFSLGYSSLFGFFDRDRMFGQVELMEGTKDEPVKARIQEFDLAQKKLVVDQLIYPISKPGADLIGGVLFAIGAGLLFFLLLLRFSKRAKK